jgi:hypothetical protein
MADKQPHEDIVRLAEVATVQKAHLLQQVLGDEGIQSHVVGDYLDAGLGSLDAINAELWVHPNDVDRARAILEAHQQAERTEQPDEDETETPT